MPRSTRLAGLVGIALGATALASLPATAAASPSGSHAGGVFVETDSVTNNQVAAYARNADGTLTATGTYDTSGKGGVLSGSAVDHTASQGAVAYDAAQRLLYAVNAGSNTVTVFAVHDGTKLTRLQVVSSGGTFPVSIAVRGNVVYVLNARDGGSLQGYLSLGGRLIAVPAWHRKLGLNPAATPEFTSTPGQVTFSPNGRQLLVTTKANTNAIDVFAVDLLGGVGRTPVVNSLPGDVPFAMAFDRSGHLAVAEAGPSAVATFSLNRDGTLISEQTAATGQAATCWIASTGKAVYTGNAGSSTVTGYSETAGTLAPLGNTAAAQGTVDLAASPEGNYLYARGGADGTISEFRVEANGSLTAIGTTTVPDGVGGEGIATF
jgi:6-phosphogluconolactonase (cycloisomerase 2 family)